MVFEEGNVGQVVLLLVETGPRPAMGAMSRSSVTQGGARHVTGTIISALLHSVSFNIDAGAGVNSSIRLIQTQVTPVIYIFIYRIYSDL